MTHPLHAYGDTAPGALPAELSVLATEDRESPGSPSGVQTDPEPDTQQNSGSFRSVPHPHGDESPGGHQGLPQYRVAVRLDGG